MARLLADRDRGELGYPLGRQDLLATALVSPAFANNGQDNNGSPGNFDNCTGNFYGAYYHDRARHYGLSPLADQQIAGGIMMSLDIIIMVTGLIYFFYYATVEADAEERRMRAAA